MKYPVFIPSKGRSASAYTIRLFLRDRVPFYVVVEPQEVDAYARLVGRHRVLELPASNQGLVFARNWITKHSRDNGDKRHWQMDDDINGFTRLFRGIKVPCNAHEAMSICEDFADRYENVAMLSPNYRNFVSTGSNHKISVPPFYLNHRCYTAILFQNDVPYDWRPPNNEDADMTLQVLAGGYCTVLMNAFMINTATTMTLKGGQTEGFLAGKRLQMVESLRRRWPGVVTVKRRNGHPQHVIAGQWSFFKNPLIRRKDVDFSKLDDSNRLQLTMLKPPKHDQIKELVGRK